MKTEVVFFRDIDLGKRTYEYNEFCNNSAPNKSKTVIAVYFDDDDDEYKTTTFSQGNKVIKMDFFSWDELSQYIYEFS